MLKKSVRWGVLLSVVLSFAAAWAQQKPAPAAAAAKKASARVPASAVKSCPETGCACEELKAFAQACEIRSHADYVNLAQQLKLDQEERRRADAKACPHTAAAEACRQKSKKQITQKKPRGTPFKLSVTHELGNFGLELIEHAHRNPRAPASR